MLLSLAGLQLLDVGGGDREGEFNARARVAGAAAGVDRWSVGRAGDRERAGGGLRDGVEALVAAPGAGEAEALESGIDDRGIDLLHHLVGEVEPLHHSGAVVLDEDVVVRQHLEQQLAPARLAQVEGDAAFVAVPVDEVGRIEAVGAGASAGVANAGLLNLDHVGAEPGERLGAGGARLVLGHVEHAHSVQSWHRKPPSAWL